MIAKKSELSQNFETFTEELTRRVHLSIVNSFP